MDKIYISRNFFEHTSKAIMILNKEGKIELVNPVFHGYLGYEREEVLGKKIEEIVGQTEESKKMWDAVSKKGVWEGEVWNTRKNGETFLEKRTVFSNFDKDRGEIQYVVVMEDSAKKRIKYSRMDYITFLPSRAVFQKKLTQYLNRNRKDARRTGVVMLNIERFQQIDKTFGFMIGDELLKKIADRLKKYIDPKYILSRISGGMFAILVPQVGDKKVVEQMVQGILEHFEKESFKVMNKELFISLSIGIAISPKDGNEQKELLRNADFARFKAVESGDNQYQFYVPSLKESMMEKLLMETDLRKAIEKEEFVLHYQPQIHISDGKIVGFEALIRWQHPELGLKMPLDFIPLAEETGLIVPMGRWALREACRQNKEWQDRGFPPVTVAVNLSLRQFQQRDFVDIVKHILEETKLEPKYLELEITESIFMSDIDKVVGILSEFRNLGIKISVDDFGTGYSSLSYIAKLPLHSLKIDKSFIQNVNKNETDTAIVSTILAMAHRLNLEVIAEGVETDEHLEFLKKEMCHKYQGFLYRPALPVKEVELILLNEQHKKRP